MIQITTSSDVTLQVSPVSRSLIDAYITDHPAPEPPLVEVQVFGGITEKVENKEDHAYLRALSDYNLRMAHEEFDMVAQAIKITHPGDWRADPRIHEMTRLGIHIPNRTEYLRYIGIPDRVDLNEVLDALLYLSTVTPRGIREAEKSFAISWMGAPLDSHPNPPGDMKISGLYQARIAARAMGYTWHQFRDLPGPDQSAIVAHYLCENKIRWLNDKKQEREAKMRH